MSVPDGLLLLLGQGPRHGYQLAAEFAASTADQWKLNTGQVYTTLERLVRDGFVKPDGVDPDDERRRIYRLTPTGTERVEQWLTSAPPAPATQRDEGVLRILLTVAVRPWDAPTVIDAQRRVLIERLQTIRRDRRDETPALLERLAIDARAVRIEADLTWLDRCEERLRAAGVATTPPNEEQTS